MKMEKNIIRDGEVATSSTINIIYPDGSSHSISSVSFKNNSSTSYVLYSSKNVDDVYFGYKEVIKLIQEQYKVEILPIYYDDSDCSIAVIKLGNLNFEFSCDFARSCVGLLHKGENIDINFSDNLAGYIAYNMIEIISKKHTLGSGK